MKISTEVSSALHRDDRPEKVLEYLAKAGFDAWDFSLLSMCRFDWGARKYLPSEHPLAGDDYMTYVKRFKRAEEEFGLICNQSHAPFPSCAKEIRDYFKRAIECTAEVGGEICVIHPDNDGTPEQNAEMYGEILPFAESYGVKIATENMYNWDREKDESCFAACATPESFCRHIDLMASDYFVACLDIGHAEMRGSGTSAVELIKALGPRLKALHIHDNDKWHDTHQLPFTMDIDFPPIVKALAEIGYDGYFTLEANRFLISRKGEDLFEDIKEMAKTARRLADMFENA